MKRGLIRGGEILLVGLAAATVAGSVLGQPIVVGYVTSGSMEPTLQPGDGFVAIPAGVAGSLEAGDVVTFRAEELNGGGLTTHRIVEETDRGYITRGDANPFTDQDGDEPPVKRTQIVAAAWQPGGEMLVIPGLGTAVEGSRAALSTAQRRLATMLGTRSLLGTSGLAYLVFGLSSLWYLVETLRGGETTHERDRTRDDGFDSRYIVGGLALVIVLSATAAMVVPAGPQQYDIISAESDPPGPRIIEQGTTETTTYPVVNGGLVPVVSFLEPAGPGVDVTPDETYVGTRTIANATVTLSAPPETGYYRRVVVEHRYLAVLPRAQLRGMYELHPWIPILVIDTLLGWTFYAVGISVIGTGRVRSRRREGADTGLLKGVL